MDTDLGMPIINKEPRTGWAESLVCYTKSIMFKIGDTTDTPLKKTAKKDRLAEELERTLAGRLDEEDFLPEAEWQLLQELAQGEEREVARDDLSKLTTLAEHGLVFVFRKGVKMHVTVPDEVKNIVQQSEDTEKPSTESEKPADMDENEAALLKIYESTKAIYGASNLTHLTKVWNDHHDVQFSVDEVRAIIENG